MSFTKEMCISQHARRFTPEAVDAIFEKATHQEEYILALYALVVPDFDQIATVEGYPKCSEEMWEYVCRKAFAFNALHHPNVLGGGAWLNWGFSSDKALEGSMVSLPSLIYKP